jgi:hypothetical protein
MDTELRKVLIYFLGLTQDVPNGDQAMFVCGRIREACAVALNEPGPATSGSFTLDAFQDQPKQESD